MLIPSLTHIDLFAGIGGFAKGFEEAGIETLAHVEIDPKCKIILKKHWPTHIILSDVTKIRAGDLPHADIVTFGSPCQDLSIAGKREGLEGQRSGLFYDAIRIIRDLNPRFAIWENVPGALSSSDGDDFRTILSEMLGSDVPMPRSGRWGSAGVVRSGKIEVAWRILDAQFFGVAQRRRRVFVIRSSGSPSATEILFEFEGMRRNPPTRGSSKERTTTYAVRSSQTGSNGRGIAKEVTDTLDNTGGWNIVPPVAGTLPANYDKAGGNGMGEMQAGIIPVTNRGKESENFETLRSGSHGALPMVAYSPDVSPALTGEGHDASEDGNHRRALIAFNGDRSGQDWGENISPPLTHKGDGEKAHGAYSKIAIAFGGNHTDGPIDISTALNAHGGVGRMDFESETLLVDARNNTAEGIDNNVSITLQAKENGGSSLNSMPLIAHPLRAKANDSHREDSSTYIAFQTRFARNGRGAPDDVIPPLTAEAGKTGKGDSAPVVCWEMAHADEGIREGSDIAPTLQARMGTGGNQIPLVGVRRLMPSECEKLQGFPVGWTEGNGQADSNRYRQLGNAICVNVARWIGHRIKHALVRITDENPMGKTKESNHDL